MSGRFLEQITAMNGGLVVGSFDHKVSALMVKYHSYYPAIVFPALLRDLFLCACVRACVRACVCS